MSALPCSISTGPRIFSCLRVVVAVERGDDRGDVGVGRGTGRPGRRRRRSRAWPRSPRQLLVELRVERLRAVAEQALDVQAPGWRRRSPRTIIAARPLRPLGVVSARSSAPCSPRWLAGANASVPRTVSSGVHLLRQRRRRRARRGRPGSGRRSRRCLPMPASSLRAARTMSSTRRPSETPIRYGCGAGRAEPLVVRAHDRVARLQPAVEQRAVVVAPGIADASTARRRRRSPIVPCAQRDTGQPPFGALPFGIATVPETASSLPSADVERYSSSVLALRALEHRLPGQLALPDRRAVRALGQGRGRRVERVAGGALLDGGGWQGGGREDERGGGSGSRREGALHRADANGVSMSARRLRAASVAAEQVELDPRWCSRRAGSGRARARRRRAGSRRSARARREVDVPGARARWSARPGARSSSAGRWPRSARVGVALGLEVGLHRAGGVGMSRVPIEETIRKRSTPSSCAASMHFSAPPRSIVCLRSAPLPGPAPAANTIASAPPTCGRTSSCSRSQSTGCAPSASRSATWSGLRISPRGVWPRWASSLRRRRAICPWPPATRTSIPRGYETGPVRLHPA